MFQVWGQHISTEFSPGRAWPLWKTLQSRGSVVTQLMDLLHGTGDQQLLSCTTAFVPAPLGPGGQERYVQFPYCGVQR